MKKIRLGLLIPITALFLSIGFVGCGLVNNSSDSGETSSERASSESVTTSSPDKEDSSVEVHTHVWSDATCDTPKTCNGCGETEGEELGHAYGEVSYVWSEDFAACTATRVCAHDSTHQESETVTASEEKVNSTCTQAGSVTYTATFENEAFETQVQVVDLSVVHTCTELKWDETEHWYECLCGEKASEKEVHFGGMPTATSPANCEVCLQPYGDILKPKITGLVIKNTDSPQYNAETKTFTVKADGSGDMPVLEVSGENFDLLANYEWNERTWRVWLAKGISGQITNGWTVEGNTATTTLRTSDVSSYNLTPWELQYTNDGGETWIPTGYYVVKEKIEVTGTPKITDVTLTGDSVRVDEANKIYYITANSFYTIVVTGENLLSLAQYGWDDTPYLIIYNAGNVSLPLTLRVNYEYTDTEIRIEEYIYDYHEGTIGYCNEDGEIISTGWSIVIE